MNLTTLVKQYPVASFIVLTVGLSFAVLLMPASGEGAILLVLSLLVIVPTFAACVLVAAIDGRRQVGAFLRQCLQRRAAVKWYLVAIAVGFVIQFGSSLVALLAGRISALEIGTPDATIIPSLIIFLPFALLENIGWRGFALRRALDRHAPFVATLIIGVAWGLIHVGLAIVALTDGRSPVAEGFTVLAVAFPITWIFIKSGRNVLVAMILHYVFNISGSIAGPGRALSMAETIWFLLASACVVAVFFIAIEWRKWFAQPLATNAPEVVRSAALAK